ncbi:MAG: alanyl-tRNA synthetase, partial [Myxococcota bacterium]
ETDVALRVIADHSRAAATLIADGIYPDNEGRGYVLRRVMRRAIRFGRILGLTEPFLVDTTAKVVELLGGAYPELVENADTIHRIVLHEEKGFGRTINAGLKRLAEATAKMKADGDTVLDGRVVFEMYDTHGFPPDLTALILAESDMRFDQAQFDAAMTEQRERARAASKFGTGDNSAYQALVEGGTTPTSFTGYRDLTGESVIKALLVDGVSVPRAAAGQTVEVVLTETPFYAESGGQSGDQGRISVVGGETHIAVSDTQKPYGDIFIHVGTVHDGIVAVGDSVTLTVDVDGRDATRKNHSATHLLHHALQQVLGEHVRQRGSMVSPDRLRFDFSHTQGMTGDEIRRVEIMVNTHIIANEPVETEVLSYDDAIAKGAIAFFGEKYGDSVRVLSVGSESVELCGGTHVGATGDIGLFKIISEGAISSGVRRLEAVTGMNALHWVQQQEAVLSGAAEALRVGPDQVLNRLEKLIEDKRDTDNALKSARLAARQAEAAQSIAKARVVGDFKIAAVRLDGIPGKEIRALAESLRGNLGSGAILVTGSDGDKVSLVVAATKDASKKLHAGKLIGELAGLVGGRGGGKPDVAQAGGTDASKLGEVAALFYDRATSAFT